MSIDRKLVAYQKAFNQIDDLMEYRGMTKEQFFVIASELSSSIQASSPTHQPDETCHEAFLKWVGSVNPNTHFGIDALALVWRKGVEYQTSRPMRESGEPSNPVELLQRAVLEIDRSYPDINADQHSQIRAMAGHLIAMLEDE